jgi:hypothetical protein
VPRFRRGQGQLEDHQLCGLLRPRALGPHRAMANSREHTFDRVLGAQVIPMFGGEVVEGQQGVPVLGQTGDRLVVLGAVFFGEGVKRSRRAPSRAKSVSRSSIGAPWEDGGTLLFPAMAYRSFGRFWQTHHPPRYAAFLTQPSPRFPHSSCFADPDRIDAFSAATRNAQPRCYRSPPRTLLQTVRAQPQFVP